MITKKNPQNCTHLHNGRYNLKNRIVNLCYLFFTDVEHVAPCEYRIGDKVQISLSTSELRVLQLSSSCGWQDQMASVRFH